ncbi:MAG: DNA-binding protein [Pseudomonadaceae bacterium]
MRKWFTVQELVGLDGLPGTAFGVRKLAERVGWEGQRRIGSKAIEYSFAVLPAEAQAALVARLVQQEQPADEPKPSAPHTLISPQRDGISTSRLNDDQRDVMSARVAIIREIQRMSQVVSQQQAILTLVSLARDGKLSPYLGGSIEHSLPYNSQGRGVIERPHKTILVRLPGATTWT